MQVRIKNTSYERNALVKVAFRSDRVAMAAEHHAAAELIGEVLDVFCRSFMDLSDKDALEMALESRAERKNLLAEKPREVYDNAARRLREITQQRLA